MNKSGKLLVLSIVLGLSLSACGDKKTPAAAAPKDAVKVNGQVISAAELDSKSGMDVAGHNQNHGVSEATMSKFVEMELLRQAAQEAKLDADEKVRARIAIATRMILATAYMEKQLNSVAKPTQDEVAAYFKENPSRFSERKLFGFQEFSLQPPPGKAEEIQAQAAKSKKPEEFEQWLTANNIPHGSTPVSVTSDRLPDDVLAKIANVPVGGNVAMGGNGQLNVVFVLSMENRPVSLSQAEPVIVNLLMEKRKSEVLTNMTKQLRDKAKIEYLPPYTAKGFTPPVDNQ